MTQVSAVAALDEPTRRRLYEFVVAQPAPVSRDEAAAAVALPRTTAAFHLDRLVAEGLLTVVHERRSGRNGPGAGRPAKLYRRSQRQISVSLPQRRYDLAGQLLADAVAEADRGDDSPGVVLRRRARELGIELGEAARAAGETTVTVLADNGFEPRVVGADITLTNCPFHALAQRHTELMCGMNLCLVEGLLAGLATSGLTARLRPTTEHCCVRIVAD